MAVAVLASNAVGDSEGPALLSTRGQSTPPDHFRPLEFLVGSCWIGTFPDGKSTDEHCFEWVFDRKFIRDRHVVRGRPGPYEGETLYVWDAEEKRLTFHYWNSLGGFSTGQVQLTGEGIVFPERHATENGVLEMKAVWRRTAPDSYRVEQFQQMDGVWKPLWTMDLEKRP